MSRRGSHAGSQRSSHIEEEEPTVPGRWQSDWDDLMDRVSAGDQQDASAAASLRAAKSDSARTKMLKEVLNSAAKANLDGVKKVRRMSEVSHDGDGGDGIEEHIGDRLENIRSARANPIDIEPPTIASAQGTLHTPPKLLEVEDAALSVAEEEDPSLKGILSAAHARIEDLQERLKWQSEPPSCRSRAPQSDHRDVVIVNRPDAARQSETKRVEATAVQFIDKFVNYESLDRLEATFCSKADQGELSKEFPGRARYHPALVGLTDYLLDHPDDFDRAMRASHSAPMLAMPSRKSLVHVGDYVIDPRPRPDGLRLDASMDRNGTGSGGLTGPRVPRSRAEPWQTPASGTTTGANSRNPAGARKVLSPQLIPGAPKGRLMGHLNSTLSLR